MGLCVPRLKRKREREKEKIRQRSQRARERRQRDWGKCLLPSHKNLGEKGVKIQKNWSLMVSSLCVYARAQNQHKRGEKFVTTNRSSLKNARVPFNLPNSGRLCGVPCFLNRTKIIMCLKESVWIQNDDINIERKKREMMTRNKLSFALFISHNGALLLCLRRFRRAKRILLSSSKPTTQNKPSYLSPYAHRPDHSLSLSLSLNDERELLCFFPFENLGRMLNPTP